MKKLCFVVALAVLVGIAGWPQLSAPTPDYILPPNNPFVGSWLTKITPENETFELVLTYRADLTVVATVPETGTTKVDTYDPQELLKHVVWLDADSFVMKAKKATDSDMLFTRVKK
ncbi:MAG: hypothetical protein ABSG85_14680 [Spirochaetia bacterium]|jgi:hypothetical protein